MGWGWFMSSQPASREQGHGDRQRGKLGPLWVLGASEAYNASSCQRPRFGEITILFASRPDSFNFAREPSFGQEINCPLLSAVERKSGPASLGCCPG